LAILRLDGDSEANRRQGRVLRISLFHWDEQNADGKKVASARMFGT
jgi:hypothetical protein